MPRRSLSPPPLLPLLALALLGAAIPSTASAQRGDRDSYASWIDTTVAFARGGSVDLSHVSGDIVVTTWDRDEVRVRAYAEHGRITPSFSRARISLRIAAGPDERGRGNRRIGDSRYELTIPADARVKAATVSGDVRVTGARGEVEVGTVSGDIEVGDVGGLTTLTTVSGDVQVARVDGDLALSTVSGDASARDVRGDVRAKTVSGELELRGIRARSVSAGSTSGDVVFEGDFAAGGRYEFTSHSGDIHLLLPDDASAEFSVQTFSGGLETAFPVTLGGGARRGARPRTLDFTLGKGGARVQVQTFSGDAVLEHAGRDGRR
ncbi:MAG TPA: DUF4097 family beta strand repeat-containing protein [Gemmatimonadaceae bacterium]|nr:DUF4097 family beta strand repeat-containing protein [Gemmatimonadaceae bacterium]